MLRFLLIPNLALNHPGLDARNVTRISKVAPGSTTIFWVLMRPSDSLKFSPSFIEIINGRL